ncbi:MAG: hypothetical protein JSW14_00575 [Candidatus Bathyarchaeum sp.]|nr:MAG: hypothetical protein JSW14_00575 [Candidatus Bathyarchaeum sp.]
MGIMFGKKRKMRNLIKSYVSFRVKERRVFNEQLKRLDDQLHDKKIDPDTHERLRDVLEAKYYREQQEEWAKVEDKFFNPLIS